MFLLACRRLAGRKRVDPKRFPEVGGRFQSRLVDGDAGGIGHPVDGVERRRDTAGIDECLRPQRVQHVPPRGAQRVHVVEHHGFGKSAQQFAMGNAGIALGPPMIAFRSTSFPSCWLLARAKRMAGRSIGTLVDGGHPAGDQFDLLAVDARPVLEKSCIAPPSECAPTNDMNPTASAGTAHRAAHVGGPRREFEYRSRPSSVQSTAPRRRPAWPPAARSGSARPVWVQVKAAWAGQRHGRRYRRRLSNM